MSKNKEKDQQQQGRRNFLLKALGAGAVGTTALTSTSAHATPGATAGVIASLEVLMKKAADKATDVAIKIGINQIEQWKSAFSITTDEASKQSNLTRTALMAVADAHKADKVADENRRIIAANQPPPSSCFGETIAKVLLNEYPEARAKSIKRYQLDFGNMLENFGEEFSDSIIKKTKINRDTYQKDEHLLFDLLREKTLTSDDEKKAEAMLGSVLLPLSKKLSPPELNTLNTSREWKKEGKRQSAVSMMNNIQKVRQDSVADRKGLINPFQSLTDNAKSMVSSKDRRDNLLGKGVKNFLKRIKQESGGKISQKEMKNLQMDITKLPEYQEYLNQLGGEPAPYLKELITMGNDSSQKKLEELSGIESMNILLADQLQMLVEEKLGV